MGETREKRWVMVVDLRRCFGCQICAATCSQRNQIPEKFWREVHELGIIDDEKKVRLFLPAACMHCDNPPCESVCPTGATVRRNDGIVTIDAHRCIGCGHCILACPYRARTIYRADFDFELDFQDSGESRLQRRQRAERNGTCTKCNFCVDKIDAGLAEGRRPGTDPEATPACVLACSAGALFFGDFNDPKSRVRELIEASPAIRINEDCGTCPSVYYIMPEE